jgi:molybdopterin synthase sulfur carrier subunit
MDGIEVIFFGQLTDATGTQRVVVPVMKDTVALERYLHERFPGLAAMKYRIAVNRQMATSPVGLDGGAQVALMPPFSGG